MLYTPLHTLQVSDGILIQNVNKEKNNSQERKLENPSTPCITDGVYVEGCGFSSTNQVRLLIINPEIRQANSVIRSRIEPGQAPFPVGRSISQRRKKELSQACPLFTNDISHPHSPGECRYVSNLFRKFSWNPQK